MTFTFASYVSFSYFVAIPSHDSQHYFPVMPLFGKLHSSFSLLLTSPLWMEDGSGTPLDPSEKLQSTLNKSVIGHDQR